MLPDINPEQWFEESEIVLPVSYFRDRPNNPWINTLALAAGGRLSLTGDSRH